MCEQCGGWCTGGMWFNEIVCNNLNGPLFEKFLVTARENRYDIMYVVP